MRIGIIGGSGLEKGDIFQALEEVEIDTPYGKPSPIKKGYFNNAEIYLVSRHGYSHEITLTNVNNRANIHALFNLGCKYILATTAVGSLRDNIAPGDFVVANQFIDFTKNRKTTFFDDFKDSIKHVSLATPFSEQLRQYFIESCEELNMRHYKIGTILTIEGPRFSTRAESFMFRRFSHVINMPTSPEAILAKEIGAEYAVVAMVTDYDCWKKTEKPVTWEEVEKIMKKNAENIKRVLIKTIEKIGGQDIVKKEREFIKSKIRTIPNFPKPGVMFRDITTLFKDAEGLKKVIEVFYEKYKDKKIDIVAGIEARGFILGGILAEKLNCGFVPIRKKGKLPYEKIQQEYSLEYGTDAVEIHKDAIQPGQKILLVDDLLATGGTALASAQLIEKLGGEILEIAFIVDLPELNGRPKLEINNYKVFSIVEFLGK